MGEVCLAANGSMENSPSRNYDGGVDGRIEEGKPDTGKCSAEVWGRKVASEVFFFFFGTGANCNSRNRKKKPADKGQRTRDKEQKLRL